jgi:hypothetical protein
MEELAVHAHLQRCCSCRDFQVAAPLLGENAWARENCSPPKEMLAKLATTAHSSPIEVASKHLVARLRPLLAGLRAAWAVPAMLAGIALPSVSLAALAHLETGAAHHRPTCNSLLPAHQNR